MRRKVLLTVPLERGYGRQVVEGVTNYIDRHSRWDVFLERGRNRLTLEALEQFAPLDGVITLAPRPDVVSETAHLPLVSVEQSPFEIHQVFPDDFLIGEMAAQHLLSLGLRDIAYAGMPGVPFSDARKDSLVEVVGQADATLHVCPGNVVGPEMHSDAYADWLESLPRPCGLLLVSAQRAPATLLHCERRGIRVPEDLAVLGVEEDPLLCRLTNPPLSTIDHNTERVGFEAAGMLDMLMAGQAVDPPVVRIPPRGVVRRQSTQMLATRHEGVVRAVRYIREHIEEPLTVAEVLRHVPVGRRSLEKAFQRHLGRGIGEEIRRQKLRLAQDLLVETTLPMADIAVRVGFSSASHMTHVFARELGTSPTAWRDEHGLR